MTIDEQLTYLKKGTVDLIREEDLRSKLTKAEKSRKPLRVKLGVDPTSPDIHLGHTVVVRRIPDAVVDAVKDADEIRRTGAEQAVEPAAVLRSQDLTPVGRTDRR